MADGRHHGSLNDAAPGQGAARTPGQDLPADLPADGSVIEVADLILQSGSTMADVTPALGEIEPGGVAPAAGGPEHGGGAGFTPFTITEPEFTPPPDPIDPTALGRTPPEPDPVSDPVEVVGVTPPDTPPQADPVPTPTDSTELGRTPPEPDPVSDPVEVVGVTPPDTPPQADPVPTPTDSTELGTGQLQTNTSGDVQNLRISLTENDGPTTPQNTVTQLLVATPATAFEVQPLALELLDPGDDYVITIEHLSGGGQTDIFGLIVADESFNTITVNTFNPPSGDVNDVALGDGGNTYDGALYVLLDDGSGGWIAPTGPIGYDISTDGTLWELDSAFGQTDDFTLNLSLVDLGFFFDDVTTLDISGNFEGGQPNNEANTIFLTADDVLDMGGTTESLTIQGDSGDTVNLVDQDGLGTGDTWAQNGNTWTFGVIASVDIIDAAVVVNVDPLTV